MDWIFNSEIWISLITLTVLEIVLGIDNIVFITILVDKLPVAKQRSARQLGLFLAMLMRILLLLSLTWIMKLTSPLFEIMGNGISGRDVILLIGGLFLIYKSTTEIHEKVEGESYQAKKKRTTYTFSQAIIQILLLDIVFSLDSVITAIGMANQVGVMIAAVVIAVLVMQFSAKSIGNFVTKHATVKMLALSFLVLIGVSLIAEGLDQHIPKGYIYFAMAFSILVEMLNLKMRKKSA